MVRATEKCEAKKFKAKSGDPDMQKFMQDLSNLCEKLDLPKEDVKEFLLAVFMKILNDGFKWTPHLLVKKGTIIGLAAGDNFCHAAFKEQKWPQIK